MKYLSTIVIGISGVILALTGCDKKDSIPYYASGSAPVLKSSVTSIAATPADSLTNVISFSWTDPKYPKDSVASPVKYTLQIDSTGRGFTKGVSIVVSGVLSDTFTAKQINTILLGFGFSFNVTYNVDVRVVASYTNNNDPQTSNTLTLTVTPYKIPPKVAPPAAALYLVGAATQGGWTSPVPVPTQVFEQVDSVDYAGVFNLNGGQQFLILPQNTGSFGNKLATNDNTETGTGGTFAYNDNNNFTGPATSGWYTIWLNFQTGVYTITPYTGTVPDSLFIVGSATPGGWTSPVPEPSQALTQINSSQFTVTLPFVAAGQYLLLPTNSTTANNFLNKYAVGNSNNAASSGIFGYNPNGGNADFGNNFNGPAAAGNYKLMVDFLQNAYTVTSQ
jgi:starch-binding outer membrane protein SusE/F